MNAELQAICDAMDPGAPGGRDRAGARSMSVDYIAAHPDEFTDLDAKTFEEVAAVDVFRAAGFDAERWRCEAWLLKLFPEPQVIGGELQIGGDV